MAESETNPASAHVTPTPNNKISGFIPGDPEPPTPPLSLNTGFHLHQDGYNPPHDEEDHADGLSLYTAR